MGTRGNRIEKDTTMNNKLCVFCKHFNLDMGDAGYIDGTPGYNAVLECRKGYWHMSNYGTVEEYRKYIVRAESCVSFEKADGVE